MAWLQQRVSACQEEFCTSYLLRKRFELFVKVRQVARIGVPEEPEVSGQEVRKGAPCAPYSIFGDRNYLLASG
jgi:hypothetical protein